MGLEVQFVSLQMASSGDLKAITDSEDMMKTVSLKDLKNAVTANIEEDLGIAEHDVHLSDSQVVPYVMDTICHGCTTMQLPV